MSFPDNATSLRAFPELRRLVEVSPGWKFFPVVEEGVLVEVKGVHVWSPSNWSDAILVRNTNDAGALRNDAEGYMVWRAAGGLVEVIDELVTRPAPGARLASRLAIARGPALWTPTPRGGWV